MSHKQPVKVSKNGSLNGHSPFIEVVARLRDLAYESGSPLLKVTLAGDHSEAEQRLRDRAAAALAIIPADFSAQLAAFRSGDTSASANLTFVGDLTNPTYTVAAVMAMTAADAYAQDFTSGVDLCHSGGVRLPQPGPALAGSGGDGHHQLVDHRHRPARGLLLEDRLASLCHRQLPARLLDVPDQRGLPPAASHAVHALRPRLRPARPVAAHPRRRRLRAGGQTAVPGSGPLDLLYGWSPEGRLLLVESSRDVNAMADSSGSKRLHKEDS